MKNNSSLPMPVRARPYLHQQNAFDFCCSQFGLADGRVKSRGTALLMEMGCGKTLVGVGVTGILYQHDLVHRVLVVAPLSVLSVWEEEYARFAHYPYGLTVLSGSCENKAGILRGLQPGGLQIVLVNYESAWRIKDSILAFKPDLIIADEAHKLKDSKSRQSKAMHEIADRAKFRMLLTGTVITNKELDVFSQYRFLNRDIFGTSFYAFRNRYFDMVGYGNHIPRFRQSMLDDFLERMHSVAFRVTKDECLDLPDITEETRVIDLEPKARKMYDTLMKESFAELARGEVSAVNVLTKTLRLSQLTGGHITDDDGVSHEVSTAKLSALEDIADSVLDEGKKLVVIARFVPELDSIEALLEKKGIGYAVIRGGVNNRDEEINRFQNDPDCRVFVGQISAAGLGITLTAASTMVFYSLSYSMSDFEQAKARIHRVSQTEKCHYIYLIAKNTVDRKVLRALKNKQDLAKALVDDYRRGLNPFNN